MPIIKDFQAKVSKKRGTQFKLLSTPKLVNDNIEIECLKCGHVEETTVANFCRSKTCPCKITNKKTPFEDFKKQANKIHNHRFKYSQEGYDSLLSFVKVKCPDHGWFEVQGTHHVRKKNPTGCKQCSYKQISDSFTKPFSYFLEQAKKKFKKVYKYNSNSYTGMSGDIEYICEIHGLQKQNVSNFLRGNGCPKCINDLHGDNVRHSWAEVRKMLAAVNPSFHMPTTFDYKNQLQKIDIICQNGHKFKRQIKHHLANDHNCPFCTNKINKPMQEIADIIKENHEFNAKPFENSSLEIDIYYPEHKLGIEFHGLIFHCEGLNTPFKGKDKYYHLGKLNLAKENNIKLIQIFEDEWLYQKDVVTNKLLYLFNKHEGKKIGARQCIIKEITSKVSSAFLKKHHIQGEDKASINLGAFYHNILVGVMTFRKNKNIFKLNRFATNFNYIVSGLGSKMFKHFLNHYEVKTVETFADKRWTLNEDNLYTKIGFSLEYETAPNYFYFLPSERIRHNRQNFMKHKILNEYPEYKGKNMTEKEMMIDLGYDRIWDCGHYKFIYEKK